MDKLMTAADVAEFLAVKPGTVYAWVKSRKIPHIPISKGKRKNCIRFRQTEIERWLKKIERETRKEF